MLPTMPEASPQPKRPRRFWRRLFRWMFLLGFVGVLLLGGGLWWGYLERVSLANRALAQIGPYQAQLEGLDLDRNGHLEVRGLVLKDRKSGATVLRLPRLVGEVGIDHLRARRLTEITLEEPEILVDQRWLQGTADAAPAAPVDPTKPPVLAGYSIGRFRIKNAKLGFHPNARTTAEVTINYEAEDVAVDASGRIRSGEQELALQQLKINSESDGARPVRLEEFRVKGRVKEGVLELDELALKQPELHATPTLLAALMGTAAEMKEQHAARRARSQPDAPPVARAPATDGNPGAGSLLTGVRIGRLEILDAGVSAKRFVEGNPMGRVLPESEVHFTYRTSGIEWQFGKAPTMDAHALEVAYLSIATPDNQGHVRMKEGQVQVAKVVPGQPLRVEQLLLQEPQVRWTPALRKLLERAQGREAPATAPPAAAAPRPEKAAFPGVLLVKARLAKADVALKDPQLMTFFLEVKGGVDTSDLLLDSRGWHSPQRQSLDVEQGRLTFPPAPSGAAKKPWLELPRGELVITPDEWNRTKRVERLMLEKPVVRIRDGNTPWLAMTDPELVGPPYPVPEGSPPPVATGPQAETVSAIAETTPAAREESPAKDAALPWWKQLHFGQVVVREGLVDLLGDLPKPVEAHATLQLSTDGNTEDEPLHRVKIENFSASLPTLSRLPFPVAQATSLEGAVRLPQMWTQRRIEELKLTGASVDAGEPLMRLFEKDGANAGSQETTEDEPGELVGPPAPKAETPPSVASTGPAEPPWEVGQMAVEQGQVTISNLIPGLSSVKFGVAFDARDLPLSPDGLSSHVAPQRIELANLRVPSPYEPLRPVAELDSVFLSFTLGGLMRKEIDKVEIVSPTLYVGEDLFWYVDYYRKYVMEGAKPGMPVPMVVAAGDDPTFTQSVASAVVAAEPPTSQAAWSVNTLQVHSGKLVVAPKGKPLKGFRDPFPFNINTQVTRGTLQADLDIPKDTYEIPDLDLQLVNMKGQVKFNLPIKQRDNNLVETFEVDSIRWKGLRTGKAFLSVTYDSSGIYAQFGAEAYDGYVNGQANVYLDDSFHWDGWIGGKNVTTHELTQVLCPGYFILDGRVEATLVAQGSKDELYQADGSFKNHSPGKFTIKALNGLINDLPKEWGDIQRKVTQIGLETLRDFEYDHAEANCRFYGREGNGLLHFKGPNGSRKFEINVYDHRWTTDKPAATVTSGN